MQTRPEFTLLDPNTWIGSVFGQLVAGSILAAILASIGWFLGPWKWFRGKRKLRRLLNGRRFTFVYNPTSGANKIVTFLDGGEIGEGRNNNENSWRIERGLLIFVGADGKVFSRFQYDSHSGRLISTNDVDARGVCGQSLEPIFQEVIGINSNRAKQTSALPLSEHDVKLAEELRRLLPPMSESLHMLREHDFATFVAADLFSPLDRILNVWVGVDFEFDDPEVEKSKTTFKRELKQFIAYSCGELYPHNHNPGLLTMDFNEAFQRPEKHQVREKMNRLARASYNAFEALIRLLRERARKQ
jgi:hypothetical protein